MAYNNNIPLANQRIKDSQQPINDNFSAIQTLINVNHGTFGAPTQGKHLFLSMPVQAVSPATIAGERAIYAKTSALSGAPELFVRAQSNGAEYEFTSSVQGTNGWTRLPSGILLKWGQASANGDFGLLFPVAANTPVFTAIYVVLIDPIVNVGGDPNVAVTLKAQLVTGFNAYAGFRTTTGATTVAFQFLAIGI